jgi:hypothetical protein
VFDDVEDEFREHYLGGVVAGALALVRPPGDAGRPLREVFPTFDDFMREMHGERDGATGRYGTWYNPNGQYDWYAVGGRLSGHLVVHCG